MVQRGKKVAEINGYVLWELTDENGKVLGWVVFSPDGTQVGQIFNDLESARTYLEDVAGSEPDPDDSPSFGM